MSQDQVLSIFKEALWVTLQVAGPVLIISIIVGLVISVIQAATQIHEQTLTFVPKLLVTAIMLIVLGNWMTEVLSDFTYYVFDLMLRVY